jgi:hypothetical protein
MSEDQQCEPQMTGEAKGYSSQTPGYVQSIDDVAWS